MKKIIIILLILFPSFNAFGGLFKDYPLSIDEYDRETGFYFTSVTIKEKGGFLKGNNTQAIDIYIFFPSTNEGKYLFEQKNNDEIVAFVYESYFDEPEKSIFFNVMEGSNPIIRIGSNLIKNNHNITKRKLRDKLLISTYNPEKETYTLWTSNKKGEHLKKLIDFRDFDEWHIDVKNSKLRIVEQRGLKITIKNLDW
jgi:hypothetical protein